MEKGRAWRRYAWTRARSDLMPTLPIEVARRRVRRARELGIDYKSYAGIRAATGRDIIALIFSSNALRLARETAEIDQHRHEKISKIIDVTSLALVHPPHDPATVTKINACLHRAGRAPSLSQTWAETRARVLDLKGTIPGDGVIVIGETALEREWSEAGRLAGFLHADTYFSATS
jgi:hypothetical protein